MASILAIDDNDLALEAIKIILEENGHTVTTAQSGDIGLEIISKQSFDLVITDLIMPGKEGMETLQEIKRDYPGTKVIVVSGGGRSSPDMYLETAKGLGADATLGKPFEAKELLTTIKNILK